MSNRLSPAFHAEYVVELFNEYRCIQKVSERANVLLSSYPAEHVQAIEKHLPSDLIVVLPKRRFYEQTGAANLSAPRPCCY